MTLPDLQHFLDAQDARCGGATVYEVARAELERGRKATHWIWFIFPQIPLGTSPMAARYALHHREDAEAYLAHAILGARLVDMATLVLGHLERGSAPDMLMGSTIDALKLASSMTLFERVAAASHPARAQHVFEVVLDALATHQTARCAATLRWWDTTR